MFTVYNKQECVCVWGGDIYSKEKMPLCVSQGFYFILFFLHYFSPQMIHTFSGCVLGSAVECDLDELLATRLVSFLMDHQQNILSVPEFLLNAIKGHVQYLRSVQVHTGTACALCILASCSLFALFALIKRAENQQMSALGQICNQCRPHSCCFDLRSLSTVVPVVPALTTWIRPVSHCPCTHSAIRSAATSSSSRSWPLPRGPWRSCWRCW